MLKVIELFAGVEYITNGQIILFLFEKCLEEVFALKDNVNYDFEYFKKIYINYLKEKANNNDAM